MLHIAIVGAGNIASVHADGLRAFSDRCKIAAVVDIYPEKARALREKYALDCEVFDSHKKLLASGLRLDIVHVCTPPYVHAEIAIDAMNRGVNVVVEKPMATCLEECDLMLETERRNKVTLAVIAQNRFSNAVYKLKKMTETGLAGRVRCAHVNSLWWRGRDYYDLWWRGLWEKEGGGPTLNHAVHHIDMLNWLRGGLPEDVTAVLANVMHDNSEVEDLSVAILRYRDNALAQVTSSVVHHGEEQAIVLQCEHAKIQAPWGVCAQTTLENGFPVRNEALEKQLNDAYAALPDLPHQGHTAQIADMLDAVEKKRRPFITGEDGRNTVELITAIYKAGFQKAEKTVTLPIQKTDELYRFSGILKNAVRFNKKSASVENLAAAPITVGDMDR
jgi:predicted dehydrogenase